ncbi:MAG: ASCH domain-containing protein [Bacteroidales bacterium]|nr:ASCH domain-containing protein [Bacteroidales bacterium]
MLHALSIKQPWATLLTHGVKTIEIRTWSTRRRGWLLIHAGKSPDRRPEAWQWITTPALQEAAQCLGGVVGVAKLVGCLPYTTPEAFAADQERHRNHPDWFLPQGLFGLEFHEARPLPFLPYPGRTSIFPIHLPDLETQLV